MDKWLKVAGLRGGKMLIIKTYEKTLNIIQKFLKMQNKIEQCKFL